MSFSTVFKNIDVKRSAEFSLCGTWRYALTRRWNLGRRPLVCCLLNPSIAGAVKDDNTVKLLMSYAHSLGYGGIIIVNLWALVSTDPSALKTHPNPVGQLNDQCVRAAFAEAQGDVVLCGWGDGGAPGRVDVVLKLIRDYGARPVCIALTKAGNPGHPLRKKLPSMPFPFGGQVTK